MAVALNSQRTIAFEDRYALRNGENKLVEHTPEEMWDRVAYSIGDTKEEREQYRKLLDNFKFVPGGRIMAGAGAATEQTFYNCYVIPVETKTDKGNDSREAIFETIATMVDIMSRGGGVGINWSTLRPSGSYLSRVSGTSSGPVGWMGVASSAVGEVEQGGSRRGAAMFMLDDWHPDLLKFIEAKRDYTKITNANVSVAISDEFMAAVKDGRDWTLRFPETTDADYNADWDGDIGKWDAGGHRTNDYGTYPARELWRAIVESAHASGEPGIVFLGRYNALSTGRHSERIISVNPCGEQGLGAYSVCNLGSMNIDAYVSDDGFFDRQSFAMDAAWAFRFLDAVIDKSFYWDERTREQQKKLRRVGLGTMGLADALLKMKMRYGSDEAVKFTEDVFRVLKDTAIEESMTLAEEKGPAGAYTGDVWSRPYLSEYSERNETGDIPLRNLFFLTQAPTGTTSTLAGVSSGIEPHFAWEYTRNDRTGIHQIKVPAYEKWVASYGPNLPDYFVTSNEVSVEDHIRMQAAAQKYIDSSVSKTINGPNSHTVEDVDKAYMLAYDSGLKGLAYFRNGSGRKQVLTVDEEPDTMILDWLKEKDARIAQLEEELLVGPRASGWRRPANLTGVTSRLNTSMGTLYLTINKDERGNPVEIFVNVGKAGSDVMAMGEAVGRLVSLSIQRGIPLRDIANQLVGVGGTSRFNPGLVHAIGRALADESAQTQVADYQADPKPSEPAKVLIPSSGGELCPECGQFSFVREEGCQKCYNCDFSAC
jgi:ribonucleoside-diphosphate reductase alpha chain